MNSNSSNNSSNNPFERNSHQRDNMKDDSSDETMMEFLSPSLNASTAASRLSSSSSFHANFAATMQRHQNMNNTMNMGGDGYSPPVHEQHQRRSGSEDFKVHPVHGTQHGRPTSSNSDGYLYLDQEEVHVQDSHNKYSMPLNSVHGTGNGHGYNMRDFIGDLCKDFCDTAKNVLDALPRWFKIGFATFSIIWFAMVVSRYGHAEKGEPKGDNGGSSSHDSNSTYVPSARTMNVLSHNCKDVGTYNFGDPVFEFDGHSYQIIGRKGFAASDGFNFFDAMIQARMRCVGGHIGYVAAIESEGEQATIADMLTKEISKYNSTWYQNETSFLGKAWLGANDMDGSGDMQCLTPNSKNDGRIFWKSKQEVNGVYSNFGTEDVNRTIPDESKNCVVMHMTNNTDTNGLWLTSNCYHRHWFAVIEYDGLLTPEANEL